MEIEIEIGEYVRTYFGEIGKCIDKSFESCVIDFNKEDCEEIFEDEFEEEIKGTQQKYNWFDRRRRLCKWIRSIWRKSRERGKKLLVKKSHNKWYGFRSN